MAFDRDADRMMPEDAEDYVPAVYAATEEEAERYCQILEDHDIPAMVDEEAYEGDDLDEEADSDGHIPVLVPAELLEDAKSCIEQAGPVAGFDDDDEFADEDGEDDDFMLSDKEFPLGAGSEGPDEGEEDEEDEEDDEEDEGDEDDEEEDDEEDDDEEE